MTLCEHLHEADDDHHLWKARGCSFLEDDDVAPSVPRHQVIDVTTELREEDLMRFQWSLHM
jgi:hypothetical protein